MLSHSENSFSVEDAERPREKTSLYSMLRSATDYVNSKLARRVDTPSRLVRLASDGSDGLSLNPHESYAHIDIDREDEDDSEVHSYNSAKKPQSSALNSSIIYPRINGKPEDREEKVSNGHSASPVGLDAAPDGNGHEEPALSEFEKLQQELMASTSGNDKSDPSDPPEPDDDFVQAGNGELNRSFIAELEAISPLPRRFKARSHHSGAVAFAVITSAVSMYLYGEGGLEQHDWRYPVGGIMVNFSQGVGFGMGTYWFYLSAFQNLDKHWVSLLFASLLAILATSPTITATYFMSEHSIFWTALQLSGYPLNIFGMDSAINEFINVFDDNSRVRKFLMKRFKENLFSEPRLLNVTADERAFITKAAGKVIGVVLGTFLTAGMFGYFCDVADTLKTNLGTDLPTSYALSILIFNFPSEVIAFLCSGLNMGASAANMIADAINHLRKVKPIEMTMRDKEFTLLLTVIVVCSILPAMFSDGTSKVLFAQCSDLFSAYPAASALEPFLKFTITYGSQAFNWIMHSAFVKKLLDYIRVAYSDPLIDFRLNEIDLATYLANHQPADGIVDRMSYQVAEISNTIQGGDAKQLETIAEAHFPGQKALWEKQPRTGMFGLFHRKNAANDAGQRLLPELPAPAAPQQANGNGYRH